MVRESRAFGCFKILLRCIAFPATLARMSEAYLHAWSSIGLDGAYFGGLRGTAAGAEQLEDRPPAPIAPSRAVGHASSRIIAVRALRLQARWLEEESGVRGDLKGADSCLLGVVFWPLR